jgi:hypothetical protein
MVSFQGFKPKEQQKIHHMKTHIIRAATPAIFAIAAILLSFRSTATGALVAGYFCVIGLCAVMALDYRLDWKRPLGR